MVTGRLWTRIASREQAHSDEDPARPARPPGVSSTRPPAVSEYAPTGAEPDGSDPMAQAEFWVSINSHRWKEAQALEARSGMTICDTDPLKLHSEPLKDWYRAVDASTQEGSSGSFRPTGFRRCGRVRASIAPTPLCSIDFSVSCRSCSR